MVSRRIKRRLGSPRILRDLGRVAFVGSCICTYLTTPQSSDPQRVIRIRFSHHLRAAYVVMSSTLFSAALPMHHDVYDSSNIGTLGRLPPEIRRQIYGLYFHRRQIVIYYYRGTVCPPRVHKDYCTDLLLVSKAIHAEARTSESLALIDLSLPSGERPSQSFLNGMDMRILDLTISLSLHGVKRVIGQSRLQCFPQLQELHLWPELREATSTFRQHEGNVDELVKRRHDDALIWHVQRQVPEHKKCPLKRSLVPRYCRAPQFVVYVTVKVLPYDRPGQLFQSCKLSFPRYGSIASLAMLIYNQDLVFHIIDGGKWTLTEKSFPPNAFGVKVDSKQNVRLSFLVTAV